MVIYTIGHSSHDKAVFLQMLTAYNIQYLIDVRSIPASGKFPEYTQKRMKQWLSEHHIHYQHIAELGGRRQASGDVGITLNSGWQNQSFHNYADYTLSASFQTGIQTLQTIATSYRTAYFCAERHPARCHRLIISNWLAANGWHVQHIIDEHNQTTAIPHQLGRWGAMPIIENNGTVVYPPHHSSH